MSTLGASCRERLELLRGARLLMKATDMGTGVPGTHLLFSQEYELTGTRWEKVFSGDSSQVVGNESSVFDFLFPGWLPITSFLIAVLDVCSTLALGQLFQNSASGLSHVSLSTALRFLGCPHFIDEDM